MTVRAIQKLSYPVPDTWQVRVGSAALLAGMVYFLLAVFQPFGTYTFSSNYKYALLLPYAAIAFGSFVTADWLFRKQAGNWLLLQELAKIGGTLVVCAVLNTLYNSYFVSSTAFSWKRLGYMSIFTGALSVPAVVVYLLARWVWLHQSNPALDPLLPEEVPAVIPQESSPEAVAEPALASKSSEAFQVSLPETHLLQIKPTVGCALTIAATDFLAAESAGNYCKVFYLQAGMFRKNLLRISLKELEAQIGTETIIRCHRSFIVNTTHVIRSKGNAQGGQVYVRQVETPVPVSRRYADWLQKQPVEQP